MLEKRMMCPLCGGSDTSVLYHIPYDAKPMQTFLMRFYGIGPEQTEPLSGSEYELRRCKACGLVYQTLAPVGELARDIYERWTETGSSAARGKSRSTLRPFARYVEQICTGLNELGLQPERACLLDVGMGWGAWCLVAQGMGCTVAGLELAENRLDSAHSRGIATVRWEDLKPDSYDFVNAEQVFEHLPNPSASMRCISSALRLHGVLRIAVPDGRRVEGLLSHLDWSITGPSDGRFMVVHPLEHVNCFTERTLDHLARTGGLVPMSPRLRNTVLVMENGRPQTLLRGVARSIRRGVMVWTGERWYRKAYGAS